MESHKGDALGKIIEMCLLEWKIDKLLTVTVDNASSNNGLINFLKRKTMNRKGTILEHEYIHMRCCAHILNLIVRDGLKEIDDSILKVRNCVRFVKSSPQKWKTFLLCAEKEKITRKSFVCLDVPSRWNSTYMKLERAEKFQKALERLEDEDNSSLMSVCGGSVSVNMVEDDTSDRMGNVRLLGPPFNDDWDKIRLLIFEDFL